MNEQPQTLNDVTERAASEFRQPCPPDGKLLCWVCGAIRDEDDFDEIAGHTVCEDCLENGDELYDLVKLLETELREAEKAIVAVTESLPFFQAAASFDTPVIETLENYAVGAGKIVGALNLYGAWLHAHDAMGPEVTP